MDNKTLELFERIRKILFVICCRGADMGSARLRLIEFERDLARLREKREALVRLRRVLDRTTKKEILESIRDFWGIPNREKPKPKCPYCGTDVGYDHG